MPNLKLTKKCKFLTLEPIHDGLIQCIFTYIAGFAVKFPNSGRINPLTMEPLAKLSTGKRNKLIKAPDKPVF